MACWSGDHGVAECREERAGVEGAKGCFRLESKGDGTCDSGGVGDGSGVWCVAVDAIRTGAENCEHFAGMMREFSCASQGELLVSSACAGCAIQRDSHFAAGDEAEAAMQYAQVMKAVKQVAGGIRIVPVIAGVVDRDEIAGLLCKGTCTFDEVVRRQQHFKN